jgi:retron-type reverse transcriptase
MTVAFRQLCSFQNLLDAFARAARGKHARQGVAAFEFRLADELLALGHALATSTHRPSAYRHFFIHEPKHRKISAAPFRDRVVHHALCNVIEPRFERLFIPSSFANRAGKGTHAAVDHVQALAQRHRFVLRADIVKHFASLDHDILLHTLSRQIPEPDVMRLCALIVASEDGVPSDEYEPTFFPGDDLLALCRPRGLPIGNLTSQFWSNCYLHPFDQFVTRELGCPAYVRYVDDFCLFADDEKTLWRWKRAIVERLARLRLAIHESAAQVMPVAGGVPWLGFVVFPGHRRVKARKVRVATRRLRSRVEAFHAGRIGFGELDASVQGWINHVRYAETRGPRRHLFAQKWFRLRPRAQPEEEREEKRKTVDSEPENQ